MKGWSIFVHAVRMVLNNIDVALRISAVPYGIMIAATLAMFFTYGFNFLGAQQSTVEQSGGFWTAVFVWWVLWVVTAAWIAITWHRFVLLAEVPGAIIPKFPGGLTSKYVGASLLIGLMTGIILVGVTMIVELALEGIFPNFAFLIAMNFAFFLSLVLFYRLTPVLPAIAIGKRVSFREAWIATSGQTKTIVPIAIVPVVLLEIFSLPNLLEAQINPYIDLGYGLVTDWVATMFGASILTTLYGNLVEGRALD